MNISLKYRNVIIEGYSDSILKSAIQKYCRRKELGKGLVCLNLLLSVLKLKDEEPQRVQTIISNTINRLIVMMSEDIGIANVNIVNQIYHYYNQYQIDKNIDNILIMYKILVDSEKTRYISDLKSVFLLPFINDENISLDEIKKHNEIIKKFCPELEIKNINSDITEFKNILKKKDFNQIFLELGNLLRNIDNRKKNIQIIWKYLLEISENNTDIVKLKYFYHKMSHREKTIYLYHAILYYVFDLKSDTQILSEKINMNTNEKPIIDYYVIDKHTKNQSKNDYDFALEGAWIYREKIDNPIYRLIYIRKKQLKCCNEPVFLDMMNFKINESFDHLFNFVKMDIIDYLDKYEIQKISQKEWDKILLLPHAQKKCGLHKKIVYISDDYTYKGIYTKDEKSFQYYIFYHYLLTLLSPNTILPISILENNEFYFIQTKNIGKKIKDQDIEWTNTKIETNVPILKRCSYINRASDYLYLMDTLQKRNCLFHLYLRYLLNIGDSGLHNILVADNGDIYGIDFEEQRNSINSECLSDLFFSRKISKIEKSYLEDSIYWIPFITNDIINELKIANEIKKYIIYRNNFLKCILKFGCLIK
jgi:hypothetical protein